MKSSIFLLVFLLVLVGASAIGFQRMKGSDQPQLTGRVVRPGDPTYETERLVSNYYTSKAKFPQLIVYCQTTKDVQNAVLWALANKTELRIRSGGHHHEGFSTGNDVIIIDVSEMKELQLDKSLQIATIQPGLNNAELYGQLFKEGFSHAGGTCSEVGISGLVLSGGIGPLIRRVGLMCDTLLSVEIVDAKGQILQATKDNEHKDLFWATCGGGGGNFGIITSMKIKVVPVHEVTWFNIQWDKNQPIDPIVEAWQKFFSNGDPNWFSHLDLWSKAFPSDELQKKPIKVLGFFYGTPQDAKRQLASILNIGKPAEATIELIDWHQAIKRIEESTAVFLTDKPEYKSTGAFVMDSLPQEAIALISSTLAESTSPLLNVLLFSMGGASSEIPPNATAYFYRKAKFFINYSSQWLNENQDRKQIEELNQLRKNLAAYTVGDYVGNPDPALKDYLTEYYGDNVKRLQDVKQKYDPNNIFHFEQSIPLPKLDF